MLLLFKPLISEDDDISDTDDYDVDYTLTEDDMLDLSRIGPSRPTTFRSLYTRPTTLKSKTSTNTYKALKVWIKIFDLF